MTVGVFDILSRVYGARGIPFPRPPKQGDGTAIAPVGHYGKSELYKETDWGAVVRRYTDKHLGTYQFLPATIDYYDARVSKRKIYDLPNAVIIISGEKEIEETTIVDVGTVFEKVFTRPYDISIIVTLIGDQKNWPVDELMQMADLWKFDGVVTLKCALTDVFLNPTNNFVMKHIAVLDNQGSENVEVIQIDGMSNIDFELELI